MQRALSSTVYILSAVIGILAFVYPFSLNVQARGSIGIAHSQDAPLVTTTLVGLSLIALLIELQGQAISAKTIAMLGVLVATASVLRFIEVAVPVPGGFSPIFVPIILSGYTFGGRFGFLMGTFTMLASALITGGVGPWLPYQMFTTGWIGITAGWLSRAMCHISRLTSHASHTGPSDQGLSAVLSHQPLARCRVRRLDRTGLLPVAGNIRRYVRHRFYRGPHLDRTGPQ